MDEMERYWNEIPIGKENAWKYETLCVVWGMSERQVRQVLHELSYHDNGDGLILIRSSSGCGFYRTADVEEIKAYRAECLNRGRRTLAPLRKIDRVLSSESAQLSITNNLKAVRVSQKLSAAEVCRQMQTFDPTFDGPMLSRMENDRCLPTPYQLQHLAIIYRCTMQELIDLDLYQVVI